MEDEFGQLGNSEKMKSQRYKDFAPAKKKKRKKKRTKKKTKKSPVCPARGRRARASTATDTAAGGSELRLVK